MLSTSNVACDRTGTLTNGAPDTWLSPMGDMGRGNITNCCRRSRSSDDRWSLWDDPKSAVVSTNDVRLWSGSERAEGAARLVTVTLENVRCTREADSLRG